MTEPQPWAGERVVDLPRASALIASAFPDLADQPVTPLAQGWDSTVFRIGVEWAFQFPRRAVVVPGLRREIAVLPALAARLPLPISAPALVAEDDDSNDPWPFVGCRFIAGAELADSDLDAAARMDVARAVGEFLRVLHGCDASSWSDLLPVDPNGRANPAAAEEYVRSVVHGLRRDGVLVQEVAAAGRLDDLLDRSVDLGPSTAPVVLSHGDLHFRHVLVEAGAAAGVIDWVDVCLADPAVDLSIAYLAFDGAERDALFAGYGGRSWELDPASELRARALAIKLGALLAAYAAAHDADRLLAESLAGLTRATL